MFNSVLSALFICMQKGDLFIGQSDNKDRRTVKNFILNDKEIVKLETFCLR